MKKNLFMVFFLLILLLGCTKKKTWSDVAEKAQELERLKSETMQAIGTKQ